MGQNESLPVVGKSGLLRSNRLEVGLNPSWRCKLMLWRERSRALSSEESCQVRSLLVAGLNFPAQVVALSSTIYACCFGGISVRRMIGLADLSLLHSPEFIDGVSLATEPTKTEKALRCDADGR